MTDQPTQSGEVQAPATPVVAFTPELQCTNCGASLGGLASLGLCAECGTSQPGAAFAPIDHDCSCRDCGYALRGLLPTGTCPECNKPIWQSLRGDYLRYASVEYLATLRSGLNWVLKGILMLIVMPFVIGIILGLFGPGRTTTASQMSPLVWTVLMLLPWCAIAWGIWKYTTIDPTYQGSADPSRARKVLRAALLSGIALLIINALVEALPISTWIISSIITVLVFAAFITMIISMLLYTKWLFSRVPHQESVRLAARYVWLLPTLVMCSFVVVIAGATFLSWLGCLGIGLFGLSWLVSLILFWNMHDCLRNAIKLIQKSQQVAPAVPTL